MRLNSLLYLFSALLLLPSKELLAENSSLPNNLIIGVQDMPFYLPYSAVSKGEYIGFNRELLDMFAKSAGYTFEYRPYPIKRLYISFLSGQVDLKYPDSDYWSTNLKKGHTIHYSQPVVEYTDGVMVRVENANLKVDAIKKLGIVAGYSLQSSLKKRSQQQKMKVYEVFDYQQLLLKTLHSELDGAYSNTEVTRYYLKDVLKVPDQLVLNSNLPRINSTRHLSTIKYPKIIEEFNQFMHSHGDQVNKLKQRYDF